MADQDLLDGTLSAYFGSQLNRDTGAYILYEGSHAGDIFFWQVTRSELTLIVDVSPPSGPSGYKFQIYKLSGSVRVQGGKTHDYGPDSPWIVDDVPGRFVYYSDNPVGAGRTATTSWMFDSPTIPSYILRQENSKLNQLSRNGRIAWARATTYFITYVEYKGRI
jgi:hypothetical protein